MTYKQYDTVRTITGETATIYQKVGNGYEVWIAGWGLTFLHKTKIMGLVK